ncbi:hypothetical protein LZD49_10030 [Dyadobacter sp. CY261]|uniref:hypothetical protein n=1 Tax=Dyadobacter sp. CY261 TaxID=2907203 RepID=UPI001F3F8068|nr:hypothetical protein [Dyadobacter sp. CY261]MCF0070810.1 hypothetical protein [Dyadobacter sp. CY261]
MKKINRLLLLLLTFFCINCASVKFDDRVDGKFEAVDMNSVCFRTGIRDSGIQCLRVSATHSSREKAFALAKKFAVGAVLLRGVSGTQSAVKAPLLPQAEQQKNTQYIENFFNSGEYLKYLDQAEIEPNEVYKIKGGYQVAINAKVAYERLNTRLLDDGKKQKPTF